MTSFSLILEKRGRERPNTVHIVTNGDYETSCFDWITERWKLFCYFTIDKYSCTVVTCTRSVCAKVWPAT